jgi:PAS domain S-box-containing protein
VIVWDTGMHAISGIPPEQALGQHVWDVRYRTLPTGRQTDALHNWLVYGFRQLLATGQWRAVEHPFRAAVAHTNGHEFDVELVVSSLETEQGYRILGTCFKPDADGLPAKATQAAYRSLIEHSPQGIVIFQSQRLVFANPAAATITGYAQRELLAFRLDELVDLLHPSTRALARQHLQEWFSGGDAPFFQEFLYQHPDGSERWVEVHITRISRQEKPALQVAFLDTTARKAAQDALRHSLEQERRTYGLLLSLSRAAQAVLRARTAQHVYRVVGEQVVALGYHVMVLTLDSDGKHVEISFVTYPTELIQDAEQLTNIPMLGHRFKLPEGGFLHRIVSRRRALYSSNPEMDIAQALGPSVQEHVSALAKKLNVGQHIGAPLMVRNQTYSILIVNGIVLREEDVPAIEAFANQAAIALENAYLTAEEQRQREDLRALSARLVRVQEAEQSRIARELHDETGQTLTAMSLLLTQAIQDLSQSPADRASETVERLVETRTLVKQTTQQIREMCFQLRPSILDEMGLVPALRWLTNWVAGRYKVQVGFRSRLVDGRLPSEIETTIYRIVQEGLTNVMRYANAQDVSVRLERLPTAVTLTVEDDGVGFAYDDTMLGESAGLAGMRERAALVGGTFEVHSQPGSGTRLSVTIPLEQG